METIHTGMVTTGTLWLAKETFLYYEVPSIELRGGGGVIFLQVLKVSDKPVLWEFDNKKL